MSGGYLIGAERKGFVKEGLEFDFAVAQDIRIGGSSGFVFCDEMSEHFRPISTGKIACKKRNSQFPAYRQGIFPVLFGTAFAVIGVVLMVWS